MPNGNKVEVTVIVNGEPTNIEVGLATKIKSLIKKALKASGTTGQSEDKWELTKEEDGEVLDSDSKLSNFGIIAGSILVLSLKAGIGGITAHQYQSQYNYLLE